MKEAVNSPGFYRIERHQGGTIDPEPREAPRLTSSRRAAGNAVGMLAIVAIMFMLFYGINMQQTRSVATSPGTAETTGQR
jgi:hypothetical protein